MIFDPKGDYVTVGGRHPLKYMQNGHGFTAKGDCLGVFNDQGEKVGDVPAVFEVPAEEFPVELPEDPAVISEREALEAQATELGIAFRSTLSTEKLKERIEAAQA